MNRKGKAFLSAAVLIIFSIQLLLSTKIATSQTVGTYYPTGYNILGVTTYISSELTHLQSDNSLYMTFRSYSLGTDTSDFVDYNASDVDSYADRGTHSNFSAQQAGPDSINDKLTEENTGGASNTTLVNAESFEGTWPPTGWTETGVWNKESDQAYDGTYSADFDGLDPGASGDLDTPAMNCSDATAIYVSFYFREVLNMDNELSLRFWNGYAWVNIEDLGLGYPSGWNLWEMTVTDSQYLISDFQIRWTTNDVESFEGAYVDLVTVKKEVGTFNYELDLEVQWTNADYDETNKELAIYVDEENNTHSLDVTGGYMIIGDGTPDWGSTKGTISFWIKWDTVGNRPWGQHDNMETRFFGSNLVIDWGAAGSLTSSTSFTAGKWYFIALVWDENTDDLYLYVGDQDNPPTQDTYNNAWTSTVSTVGVTQNNFMAARGGVDPMDGHGEELRYWDIDRTLAEIQSDYDTELTGSETNLRSYFKLNNNFDDVGPDNNDGSGSGSYSFSSDVPFDAPPTENIRVDVWNGTAWQNLFTVLTRRWNNVSVSSYLNSSTFTIRFRGGDETGDTTQDSWNIDVTLLHVWSNARVTAPFSWATAILYALPVLFGFLFIVVVKLRRKKKTDSFSESFGMTHQQMIGKKMLLEIDPTSDYHKALFKFASEATNSGEPLFIFTSTNSALHSALRGAENVKFYILTSNTSSLQQINEREILLPAHDLSVLLNASVEVQKVQKEKTINMLFDNISSIIIRCGFEKTYNFMHFLLEAISSPKATALFVFNPVAHDRVISSSIRGLFHNQLAYTKSGPKVGAL